MSWADEVGKRLESMVALRRDFHRHPELSFQEKRTSEIIADRLTKAGLEVKMGILDLNVSMGSPITLLTLPCTTRTWRSSVSLIA